MTSKDIQRDHLQKEAESSRTTQIFSATTGLTAVSSGTLLLSTLDKLDPSRRTLGKLVAVISIVIGGASFALSFLGGRWAKKAEDEIKQIDREQSINAVDISVNNFSVDNRHVARDQQEQLSNTSEKSL